MGNSTSRVAKRRKRKKTPKPTSSNSSNFGDNSFSSMNSLSEETISDTGDVSPENLTSEIFNMVFVKLWEIEYSAPVDDILSTTGKILDAGCGSCAWLINMSRIYPTPEYTGVDLNPITHINYPPNVKVIKGDLLSLPYYESQFDFTRAASFSCDFTDDEWVQGISEMIRVTKGGGWIELWEAELSIPKNAPTYLKFVEGHIEYLSLNGITRVSPTKLEYFLYNTRKLDNIQCSIKSLIIGKKGGENGVNLMKALTGWFLEFLSENLSNYMGVSREEYKRKWTIAVDEIEKSRVEIICYRFWAQKKMNLGVN